MISNQILQNTIEGLKAITRIDICVMDTEGKALATTMNDAEEYEDAILTFVESPADSQLMQGYQFFKVFDENQLEYVILAKGDSDDVYMVGKIASFQIQNLLVAYKERYDKDNFIKNLLLDNLLLVDIYNRAKKLHIETDVRRVVFLIETKNEKDVNALETVRGLFAGKTQDFITAVDEKNIILVKELKSNETYDDMEKTAKVILDMLNTEAMTKVQVAYGTIVNEIKDVSRSYKEAKMALDVGKIFYSGRDVVAYGSLGIGRLIYQLPMPLCKMFIKEIFDGKSPDEFDEETLTTINKFFENSLNVSETSRQLYIHRNTLVYRLDKLQKSTNLDLRVFEDAITFKIALMVVKIYEIYGKFRILEGNFLMHMAGNKSIIKLQDVSMAYPNGTVALQHVNLEIQSTEFAFVVGSSGSGKSTFIKLLLKEVAPTEGKIYVNDVDLATIRHKKMPSYRRGIGCVFQDFKLLRDRNAYENVAFAQKIIGVPKQEIPRNVMAMLSLVGLEEKANAFPKELSGGEQQRVAIARALVNRPRILLADEPTGNLDPKTSWEIMALLLDANKRGTTIVVVTHNNEIVDKMKKRVISLEQGLLVADVAEGSYIGPTLEENYYNTCSVEEVH